MDSEKGGNLIRVRAQSELIGVLFFVRELR
jgi:hypothetical protein